MERNISIHGIFHRPSVTEMFFGINRDSAMTLNEIGEEFDLARERVRAIKEKAVQRLRHRSRSQNLRRYV